MNEIINQIQALLNKTVSNGCTEAEAATSAAIAQRLLTKHRLTMADVSVSDGSGFNFNEFFNENGLDSGSKISQWKMFLFSAVCKANGCEGIIRSFIEGGVHNRRRKKLHKLIVIGEEKDATLVGYFYNFLKDAIETMVKKNKPSGLGRGESKNWSNSFKLGCVVAIKERLEVASKEVKEEACGTTAMVRLDQQHDALQKWKEQKFNNLKTKQASASVINNEAFERGKDKGSSINLNPNVLS